MEASEITGWWLGCPQRRESGCQMDNWSRIERAGVRPRGVRHDSEVHETRNQREAATHG